MAITYGNFRPIYRTAAAAAAAAAATAATTTTTTTTTFYGPWTVSGTTRVSRYQKGKTNLDLLEQEIVSGSGIS